jgi:hypothetical protein
MDGINCILIRQNYTYPIYKGKLTLNDLEIHFHYKDKGDEIMIKDTVSFISFEYFKELFKRAIRYNANKIDYVYLNNKLYFSNESFIIYSHIDYYPKDLHNKFWLKKRKRNDLPIELLYLFEIKMVLFLRQFSMITREFLNESIGIYYFKYWILNHFLNKDIIKLILL